MTPFTFDGAAGQSFKHLAGVTFRAALDPDAPIVRVYPLFPLPQGVTRHDVGLASAYHEGRLSLPDEKNVWRGKRSNEVYAQLWDRGRLEQ